MSFRTRTILLAGVLLAAGQPLAEAEPVLRVGTSGDYRPFSDLTPDGYRGFDIAVAERFARDTGTAVVWAAFRWPELLEAMKAGRFDVAMSGVTIRPERSIRGRFTVPVVETGAVILVRGATWRRLGITSSRALEQLDAAGVKVAVNAGGHLERVARHHFPSTRIRAIPDNGAVRNALVAGEVDAIVTDSLEAPGWLQGLTDVRLIGPFTRDYKAYWVHADDGALATRLDAWLIAAERDGSLATLRAEWFGEASGRRTATPLEALLAACDERLALMTAVAEYKRASGVAVVDPERESRVLEAGWRAVAGAAEQLGHESLPRREVERFYRAQIAAAVAIQQRILAGPTPTAAVAFDLAREIRPALLRIGERMAILLLLTAHDSEPAPSDLHARVEEVLAKHQLPAERTRVIADAIAGLRR